MKIVIALFLLLAALTSTPALATYDFKEYKQKPRNYCSPTPTATLMPTLTLEPSLTAGASATLAPTATQTPTPTVNLTPAPTSNQVMPLAAPATGRGK